VELSGKIFPTSVGMFLVKDVIVAVNVLDIIEELGEKERGIYDLEFVSPVFYSDTVVTSIDGLVYSFKIRKVKPGWYKIRPVNEHFAKIIGDADIGERDQYLRRLGRLRVTLTLKRDQVFLAIPDKANKYGLPFSELIPVLLFDDTVLNFDRVIVRYDGANCWFESVDMGNDPVKADYLRESLEKFVDPKKINYPKLSFEEKMAFSLRTTFDKKFLEDKKEVVLRNDVEHAGGKFVRFQERSDHFSVTYRVDGEEFTSHISKDDRHMVIAAGICLAGNDHRFDLKSLITVVREARQRGIVHRFNVR
jgi:hypothetical protein